MSAEEEARADEETIENKCGGGARHRYPFADPEAGGVQQSDDGDEHGRDGERAERRLYPNPYIPAHELAEKIDDEDQQAGEIGQVARPVQPAAHEAGERALRLTRPGVDRAVLGIPRRQVECGEDQRRQEKGGGDQPDRQRFRPGGRTGRQPADGEIHRQGVEQGAPESGLFDGVHACSLWRDDCAGFTARSRAHRPGGFPVFQQRQA